MIGLRFQSAAYLWLLVLVAIVVLVQVRVAQRRTRAAEALSSAHLRPWVTPRRPGARHLVVAIGVAATIAAIVFAAARPARSVEVPRELSTVVVALDASTSMEARDVAPNRLRAAKDAAARFVERLPSDLRVAYVAFSGMASVDVLPTDDRAAVLRAIKRTRLGSGTAIGEAIYSSLDAIAQGFGVTPPTASKPVPYEALPSSAVVLLSDGETNEGRPNGLATNAARVAQVPISTIAFGTPGGRRPDGEPVPVNAAALRTIAKDTKGVFFRATSGAELEAAYSSLRSVVGYRRELRDVTSWFAGAALALGLLTALASTTWFARMP